VNATGALESIAGVLNNVSADSVEDLLVSFDALVAVSDEAQRSSAAKLLRDAAATAEAPERRDRLVRAADDVAAGKPAALTPAGLTAKQAAAEQTITKDELDKRNAVRVPPPPRLPHLRVRNFFPGLIVRVGRDLADAGGRALAAGTVLNVLDYERSGDAHILHLLDGTLRFSDNAVVENAGNLGFQPVPAIACLEALWKAIDSALRDEEDSEEEGPDSEASYLDDLRRDVDACGKWLARSPDRGPAPRCPSGPSAAKAFGRDHELSSWIPLLFAGITVATP
jgi:hypothetical protein